MVQLSCHQYALVMAPSIWWVCFFTAHMHAGRRIHPLSVWGHSTWSRTLQLCLASSSSTLQTTGEDRGLLLAFSSFSSLLSFSLLLFAPSVCCTYLNPVVKCYNIFVRKSCTLFSHLSSISFSSSTSFLSYLHSVTLFIVPTEYHWWRVPPWKQVIIH